MTNINWCGVYHAVTTQYSDDTSINFAATQAMASRFDLSKFNLD